MRPHEMTARATATAAIPDGRGLARVQDGQPATEGQSRDGRRAGDWQALPDPRELVGTAQQTAREIYEAEEALDRVRARFERAEDPAERDRLAAEALDHVERQLNLTRDRRRQLDSVEAKLWSRRNRIERLLIHTRGSDWWRAHRNLAKGEPPDEP
jgi:hypothetical protein